MNGNFQLWDFLTQKLLKELRICQFRIQLSQKATILQKLKWLFNNKIELEYVDQFRE